MTDPWQPLPKRSKREKIPVVASFTSLVPAPDINSAHLPPEELAKSAAQATSGDSSDNYGSIASTHSHRYEKQIAANIEARVRERDTRATASLTSSDGCRGEYYECMHIIK
jgi:hypothetical protein